MAVTALLLAYAAPVAGAAEGERVLDLQLSLVGGCKTTSEDAVLDPGPCPLETESPPGPGVPGVDHPPKTFSDPRAVATDDYGNIYVSSYGSNSTGSQGRIDVFCSDGTFISELVTPGPTSLAIDSEGHLYVFSTSQGKVLRFDPAAPYQPGSCEVGYDATPDAVVLETLSFYSGLAINRDNDHLFGNFGGEDIIEYGSAEEGNAQVRKSPGPSWGGGAGMAVNAALDRMYASAGFAEERIDIFDLSTPVGPYAKIGSIDPASVPAEDFGTQLSIAVNEGNGHVFVLDGENCNLYEFEADGTYLATVPSASVLQCTEAGEIGVDNGPFSPNGALSTLKGRYLYVPSHEKGIGHSFAFREDTSGPPKIESTTAANVSEDEAELQAQINPNSLETTFAFEYITEQTAEKNEEEAKDPFAGATPAGGGTLAAGNLVAGASAAVDGLSPGTAYRFRVVATNEEGEDEAEGSFATYPNVGLEPNSCPNALLRTGPSALLPDCRAYELVTPADTNARAPLGVGTEGGGFTTRQVQPAGDKLPFRVEGGSLPGLGGTGSLVGDAYLATRTPAGWSNAYTGPSGEEATQGVPGTPSPDQGYSFWAAAGKGSAVLGGPTYYVRYPDGHSELLGQGSLGIDPESLGQLISEGGGHIVFSTGALASSGEAVQLEPEAAPDGTSVVYDRTADGVTHVVSLKPGEFPFGFGENAGFQGASPDGKGIAFKVGNVLYLRYDNEETFEIGTGVEFAGFAEGGGRIFYVEGGDLKAFDVVDEEVTVFADAPEVVIPVTVSSDGSTAYFVSESAIAGSGPNPEGEEPQPGAQNLYRSEEGQAAFLGTVTDRDVEGTPGSKTDGLGLWVFALSGGIGELARVPARSTPDGSVFLFKSRAALTGYDPEGHAEIYRYDSAAGELECLSCNPTGAAASTDASLQSESRGPSELFSKLAWPENLRADGRRAFFESTEPLVASDADGLQDVYEWEDQGVGSCTRPGGCLYLISSPQSTRDEYLWAVSRSGDDVFFLSSGLLTGSDVDETPSIYDARAGGGFAEEAEDICEGEGCRPSLSPPPPLPAPLTPVLGAGDQTTPAKRCPKGKHKVKRGGKVRCARKMHHKKKSAKKHRAGANRKGGRR
ncbi:MAG TPA: hypothetical protein VNS60_13345 [Solirubrobacterales bacterium]|nr:hypothetical protein [Solirubrobacterales bacterium]